MVELNQVVKTYNRGKANEYKALHGISMKIEKGEMVAIVGASGAGKSTLLHILACIDGYDSGLYTLDQEEIGNLSEKKMAKMRNEKIGMVMRDFALVESFTGIENVLIPMDFADKKLRKNIKERRKIAQEKLELVQMEKYGEKPVKKLSGGQKQRIAIARAIANEPALILADEPTGALDSKTSQEILKVFRELNQQGRTIVIVTHDKKVAAACDRIIEISDGLIV